jgi:hypothetical protein
VAAVRTALHWQFNVRVSEEALVALGTTAHEPLVRTGSTTHHLRRMVREANRAYNQGPAWTLRVRRQGSVRDLATWLAAGRLPIVQVYVPGPDEHHAVVVLSVEADHVQFFDPAPHAGGVPHFLPTAEFLDWWWSPTSRTRWWAVVNGGVLVRYPSDVFAALPTT